MGVRKGQRRSAGLFSLKDTDLCFFILTRFIYPKKIHIFIELFDKPIIIYTMKTPFPVLFACMICMTFLCSFSTSIPNVPEERPAGVAHFTDDDLQADGLVLSLKISREEALERGISNEEYDSALQSIDRLNMRIAEYDAEHAIMTKASGDRGLYAWGIINADVNNNYYGSMPQINLSGYAQYRLVVDVSVTPPSYQTGAHLVYVDTQDIVGWYGPFYSTGPVFNDYVTGHLQLWYSYTPDGYDQSAMCGWVVYAY